MTTSPLTTPAVSTPAPAACGREDREAERELERLRREVERIPVGLTAIGGEGDIPF